MIIPSNKINNNQLLIEDRCYVSALNHSIQSPLERLSLWIRFVSRYGLEYKICQQDSTKTGNINLRIRSYFSHTESTREKFIQGLRLLSFTTLKSDLPHTKATMDAIPTEIKVSCQLPELIFQTVDLRIQETLARHACEEQLRPPKNKTHDLGTQVSDAISRHIALEGLETRPRIEFIANQLGTNKRTLQRDLTMLGTNFSAILEHIVIFGIIEKLSDPSESIDHISRSLGYNNSSNLSRACNRYLNATPKAIRRVLINH